MQTYIFLFLLLTSVFAQQTPNEDVQLNINFEDLMTCIQGIQPIYLEITDLIEAIKSKNYEQIIPKVYEILSTGNESVLKCLNLFPEAIEYLKEHIPFDWNEFMKCVLDTQIIAEDIYELVQVIKTKDYNSILSVVFQMILDGNDVVRQCIQVFKKEPVLSAHYDLMMLTNCLNELRSFKLKTESLKVVCDRVEILLQKNQLDRAYVMLAEYVVKYKIRVQPCEFIYIK